MKLINLDNSWGEGILQDWYIHSVDPDDIPQWTDEHIEELCKDFYVIPKETTKYDIDCNPDRLKELVEFFYERRKKGVGGEKRMTDIEKVKLKSDEAKIALHYGKVPQALKLFEEFGECEEALRGYINGTDTKEHAIEEIADVEVMIDQFKYFLDCEKQVEDIKRAKVDRQLLRMEAEK